MERISRQQQTAAVVLCCLFLIGAALFVRRLAGAFSHELPAGEAALYACLFTTAVVASLRSLEMLVADNGFASSVAALVLSLLFVAGLSSDAANVLTCLASVAIVIALSHRSSDAAVVQQPVASAETQVADELAAAGEAAPVPASRVSLMRSTARGTERIEGSLAIEFEAHEQTKTLHVPLWPPLEAEPTVECRLEGLDGRVRVPLAKRHGFRIEVRLPEACDEPLAGTLKFTATAACRSAAA